MMRQQITINELVQLDEKERERLADWMINRGYLVIGKEYNKQELEPNPTESLGTIRYPALISIGQMMHFLKDNGAEKLLFEFIKKDDTCEELWILTKKYLREYYKFNTREDLL